jgi:hypothetical protein
LENALEQEQEFIVNRLQKQLDAMRMEQSASTSAASSWQDKEHSIASGLPIGSSPINIAGGGRPSRINSNPSPTPSPTHRKWIPSHSPSSSDHAPSHPILDMLKAELATAKVTLNELERECMYNDSSYGHVACHQNETQLDADRPTLPFMDMFFRHDQV